MSQYQDRVREIYDVVTEDFFLSNRRMRVNGEAYEPVALFGTLTALLNGKELIGGHFGRGKTTSSEALSALMYGLPLEVVQANEIHGHKDQTEDKWKATLNLGKLEKDGEEEVLWNPIVSLKPKVVDEINRLPEGEQDTLLNEVDRNIWSYRGDTVFSPPGPFYATINRRDGDWDMRPALLDRFDVYVEVTYPGPLAETVIRKGRIDENRNQYLGDHEAARNILNLIGTERTDPSLVQDRLTELTDGFKTELDDRLGTHVPRSYELEQIRNEILEMPLEPEADLFVTYLASELQYCARADKETCEGCHYADSSVHCQNVTELGGRFGISLERYARALAWFNGDDAVTLEHTRKVAPHTLAHRVEFDHRFVENHRRDYRDTSIELHLAKTVVDDIAHGFNERKDLQREAYEQLMEEDDLAVEMDHPVMKGYETDATAYTPEE